MITVGELLKKEREKISKSIEEVSLETKIQPRFLKFLENNQFDKFDSNVYAQGFLKIYAKYLDIDEDRILAIYRRSVPKKEVISDKSHETKKTIKSKRFLSPKLIGITISVLFILAILGYIGYQIYLFQSPPQITVISPAEDIVVEDSKITVSGKTDINSSLFINDEPVEIEEDGNFSYNILLNTGNNIITILAKKNNSTQENIETRRVRYEPIQEDEMEEGEEDDEENINIVKLVIENSSAWVQLNIDKENKLSQILQAGEEFEFEVEEEFSITTGRANSTNLFFNEQPLTIPTNNNVGSLTCEINEDNEIICE